MNLLTRSLRPRQRFIIVTLIILFINAATPAGAQEVSVTFPQRETTLAHALDQIEKQTDYLFIYNADILDVTMRVELPLEASSLSDILRALEPQIGYSMISNLNYIVVYTAEPYKGAEKSRIETRFRTGDIYTPIDPAIAGIASYPRPVRARTADTLPLPEQSVNVPQPERSPAYSTIIPVDQYSPIKESLPGVAVKTNILYTATTFTPNLAVEVGIGSLHTIEIAGSHNYWHHKAKPGDNEKLKHWIVRPEYRYWFCERFNGHFIGAHAFYSGYNISGKNVPMLFEKKYRYHGWAVGGGVSYGYHWAFAKKWGLEFNVGVGAAYLDYDRYSCKTCDRNSEHKTKTYVGPTRAGISLVFMIK